MEQNKKNFIHPVDKFVGIKLRQKRILSGLSQEDIGKALGLTFQQIQKYETGQNRISCSKLYELSAYLNVSINYFFEGFYVDNPEKKINSVYSLSENDNSYKHLIEEKDIMSLVRIYCSIEDEKVRKKILSFIKVFSPLETEDNNKFDKIF